MNISRKKDSSREDKSFSSKKNSSIKGRRKSAWSDQELQQIERIKSIVKSLYENDESSPRKAEFSNEDDDD